MTIWYGARKSSQINLTTKNVEANKSMDWIRDKMHQARLQRNRLQENAQITPQDNPKKSDAAVTFTRPSRFHPPTQKLSWLTVGIALGAMFVSMMWWAELIGAGDDGVSSNVPVHHQFVGLPAQSSSDEEMKEDLVNLNMQVQTLTSSVADLKVKLLEIHTVTNSIVHLGKEHESVGLQSQGETPDTVSGLEVLPPPAAGLVGISASDGKHADKSSETASSAHSTSIENFPPATGSKPQEVNKDYGPWVINLTSLPRKADAERFMVKAESKGVEAGLHQVTVRDKNYWRVHVSGFATATEAKASASLIKEKLGLKDVWVTKR